MTSAENNFNYCIIKINYLIIINYYAHHRPNAWASLRPTQYTASAVVTVYCITSNKIA